MDKVTVRLTMPDGIDASRVTGAEDRVLRAIEQELSARIVVRGDSILLSGDSGEVELASQLFNHLFSLAQQGQAISCADALHAIDTLRQDSRALASMSSDVLHTYHGHAIRPKTRGQKHYVDAIRSHTVTFCFGPAGTGKTYLAMAMAVAALKRHEVGRLVLTRPVVEAGENLGFLPGTLEDKVDPYVRPLFDALFDMMDAERASALVDQGTIEIAPLAYMRGRTLNDAFVILDEAQNTTPEQMKMFLTRLGFNTKLIITGDLTQRDLIGKRGGLDSIEEILSGIDDISFIHLNRRDVVRHSLVGRIVEAYEAYEGEHAVGARRDERRSRGGSHR